MKYFSINNKPQRLNDELLTLLDLKDYVVAFFNFNQNINDQSGHIHSNEIRCVRRETNPAAPNLYYLYDTTPRYMMPKDFDDPPYPYGLTPDIINYTQGWNFDPYPQHNSGGVVMLPNKYFDNRNNFTITAWAFSGNDRSWTVDPFNTIWKSESFRFDNNNNYPELYGTSFSIKGNIKATTWESRYAAMRVTYNIGNGMGQGGYNIITPEDAIPVPNGWAFYAVVRSTEYLKVYINSELVYYDYDHPGNIFYYPDTHFPDPYDVRNTFVGNEESVDDNARIDEVGYFKAALSQHQIQCLYNLGQGNTYPFYK